MREMYLWFSILGWVAAVIFLTLLFVIPRRKRHS